MTTYVVEVTPLTMTPTISVTLTDVVSLEVTPVETQALTVVEQVVREVDRDGGDPTFVGTTQPSVAGKYLWWDTSQGLTLWIEDGQ